MLFPHFKTPLPPGSKDPSNPFYKSNFEVSAENLPIQIKENISGFGYDLGKNKIFLDIYIKDENLREIFLVEAIKDLSVKYHSQDGKVFLEINFMDIEDSPTISSFSDYSEVGILTKRLTFIFKDYIVLLD